MIENDPSFDECGEVCGNTGEPVTGFCVGCPIKEDQAKFEELAKEQLEARQPGGEWKRYGLPLLIRSVNDAARFESLPESDQTLAVGRMVAELKSERNRMRRVDDFNEKKKAKAK